MLISLKKQACDELVNLYRILISRCSSYHRVDLIVSIKIDLDWKEENFNLISSFWAP